MLCEKLFAMNFYWYSLIISYYATFFQDSVNKLLQDKAPGKSDFVINHLSTTWPREELTEESGPIPLSNWTAELNSYVF